VVPHFRLSMEAPCGDASIHIRLNEENGLGLLFIHSVVVLLLFLGRCGGEKGKTGSVAYGFGGGRESFHTAERWRSSSVAGVPLLTQGAGSQHSMP
jgi:hypothetical protein